MRKVLIILEFSLIYATLFFSTVFSKVYFLEEFSDGDEWQERWILSEHPSRQWGFFILSAGAFYGHPQVSKGIQTFQNGMHYGISTKFSPFSNNGSTLVIQFSSKHEQNLKCGGGYIKLFDCKLQPEELNDKTPYLIMFGPDKCIPTTFKLSVIIRYKENYYEIKKNITPKFDIFTHVYTLIIKPDNTYMIKMDNVESESGKLKDDWNFFPPEEILDNVKKPKDWEDNSIIYDPNDKKPDDWDQSEFLPDPTAVKPSDWDDHLDGEWEPPLIDNPAYKGIWKPRRIANPKYKGPWTPPKIKNPKFVEDPDLYKFDEICAVGFDIWQVEAGSVFDNILLTDDIEFAEEHAWKVWGSLRDSEIKMAKNIPTKYRKKKKHAHDEL